jgi:tetratricopeptide (TPR) repeat protein
MCELSIGAVSSMKHILLVVVLGLNLFSCGVKTVQRTEEAMPGDGLKDTGVEMNLEESGSDGQSTSPPPVAVPTPTLDARLDQAVKDKDDARIQSVATEILSANPRSIRALMALSALNLKRGKLEASEIFLKRVLKVNPNHPGANNNLGLIYLQQNNDADAIRAFKTGLRGDSRNAIIGGNLGSLYVKAKDYQKALIALEGPIQKSTTEFGVWNNYAISLYHTGKKDEAEKIYEKLLKQNPSSRDIMLNYSVLLIDGQNKFKQGLDLINRLKFVGIPAESRNLIKDLENKAKLGLNK